MSGLLQCWNEVAKLTGCTVCDAAEEGGSGAVEVGLQEAIDILTAATKGCGSYAKPILRHITTVAEFAKRGGVQVCAVPLTCMASTPCAWFGCMVWSAV